MDPDFPTKNAVIGDGVHRNNLVYILTSVYGFDNLHIDNNLCIGEGK